MELAQKPAYSHKRRSRGNRFRAAVVVRTNDRHDFPMPWLVVDADVDVRRSYFLGMSVTRSFVLAYKLYHDLYKSCQVSYRIQIL